MSRLAARAEQHRLEVEREDRAAAEDAAFARLNVDLERAGTDTVAIRRAHRQADLRRLEICLIQSEGPDIVLDALLEAIAGGGYVQDLRRLRASVPAYTALLDAARGFVDRALPGFYVASGLCGLTGHCSLGPDYNGADGDRLRRDWPLDETPCDWSEDLAPGDGIHRECRAILAAAVRALAFKNERT